MHQSGQDQTSEPRTAAGEGRSGADVATADSGRASTPKWIAALIVTALVAAGSAWFLTERSTREDLGQPVALDELDPSASTTAGSDSGDIARGPVADSGARDLVTNRR